MPQHELIRVPAPSPPSRWSRFVDAVRSSWSGPLTSNSPEIARLWGGAPVSSGVDVNEHTALNYSAVWAAVSLISSDVASLPLILYKRRKAGGKDRYIESNLYKILHDEPNPEMTAMVFRETLQAHVLTWGNAYAEIERDGGNRVAALWPLEPHRVTPFRDGRRLLYRVDPESTGRPEVFEPRDILHIPGLGFDGTCGYSVITKARESMGLGIATERFGGAFFGNGSTFGGVFEHPTRMSPQAQKNFRESLEARHQGVDRAHKFLIVEEAMKFSKLGVNPNDAQFLETRKFQIEEIARWFKLPPHKIGAMEHATFSNIEHQDLEYYKSCLRGWLERWEQEINRKLISPLERNIQFAEHMIEGAMRGDLPSRYSAYAVGRQWGWLSADDVREKENMNPLPDGQGKIYLVPMNMSPADRLGDIIDAQVRPPAPPQAPEGNKAKADEDAVNEANERVVRAEAALAVARADVERQIAELEGAANELATTAEQLTAQRVAAAEAQARYDVLAPMVDDVKRERDALVAHVAEVAEGTRIALAEAEQRAAEAAAQAGQEIGAATLAAATAATALADAERTLAEARIAQQQAEQAVRLEREAAAHQAEQSASGSAALADMVTAAKAEAAAAVAAREAAEQLVADARAAQAAAEEAARVALEDAGQRILSLTETATAAQEASARALASAEAQASAATEQAARRAATEAAEKIAAAEESTRVALADAAQRVTGASAAREAAEAIALAAKLEATASEEARAAAEARALAESTEKEAAAEALKTQRAAEQARLARVVGAHRALIVDAMGRMIRRETEKARRAQATPEKLRTWMGTFYPVHEDVCRAALLPAIRTHLAWQGSEHDPSEVTAQIVSRHVEESLRQLRLVLETDPEDVAGGLETVLRRWELERPDQLADQILKEAVDYVRTQAA